MEKLNQEVMEVVEVSETIKEIPGFSRYLCDITKGKIYRKPTDILKGKWLNQSPNEIGYVGTTLVNDEGKKQFVYLHELVMSAAIDFPKSWWQSKNLEVDHRNRIKWQNDFDNLKLVTKKQNHENIGDRKVHRMLTKEEVNYIREDFEKWDGKKIPFYMEKARELGCVWQSVQYCILGYYHNTKKD